MGYPSRTPKGNDSPTVTFGLTDADETSARLKKAGIAVTVRRDQMRISPSVFNNQEDIDKLLRALTG